MQNGTTIHKSTKSTLSDFLDYLNSGVLPVTICEVS